MHFCGPLPPDTVNEQEVPSDIRRELTDPLAAGQKVKALKIHVGPKLTCIMYGADKVSIEMFFYATLPCLIGTKDSPGSLWRCCW